MRAAIIAALIAAAALAGCVNLAPDYTRPAAPIPAAWPMNAGVSGTTPAASIDWATFISDARLRKAIEITLRNNRDLRIAVLNIERARAQYRIERSARFPAIGASASAARQRNAAGEDGGASTTSQYNVELGFASYELDLFGRVKNLSQAALENFFAFDENRRSTQISLIAEVATAWLTLAADGERLRLARETLRSQQASYELSRRTYELGGTSGLTVAQALTTVEAARVEVARFISQVALDRNALELLAGTALRDDLLPSARLETASILVAVPAGPAIGCAADSPRCAGGRARAARIEREHRRGARGVFSEHSIDRRRRCFQFQSLQSVPRRQRRMELRFTNRSAYLQRRRKPRYVAGDRGTARYRYRHLRKNLAGRVSRSRRRARPTQHVGRATHRPAIAHGRDRRASSIFPMSYSKPAGTVTWRCSMRSARSTRRSSP